MPPVISGYNDEVTGYTYDPEKAKALLAEAGYDGKEIELWAMPVPRPYMPDGQKVAEAIQKNLEDVGIKSKIVSFEWATYLEKLKTVKRMHSYLAGQAIMGMRITSYTRY